VDREEARILELQTVFLALVRTLVDEPEAVILAHETTGAEVLFRLSVGQRDLGKVIGKQGRTARSLRVLLVAAGMKYHRRFELEILSGMRCLPHNSDIDSRGPR
jgi:predicted RNA-binding protein YlqC (UPF0109 family)